MNPEARNLKIEIIKRFSTQSDFALKIGDHESKVSQVLHGRRRLTEEDARRWIRLLNCDPAIIEPFVSESQ
jgi:antitoxin component HigA of HigAB toxin-antitoxin module